MSNTEDRQFDVSRRVDLHEAKITNIDQSLVKIEQVLEKQGESMAQMSEAIIKLVAQNELLQGLMHETRDHTHRLGLLEKDMAVVDEKVKRIPKLGEDLDTLKTGQVKNTTKIAAIASTATLFVTSTVAYIVKKFFDLF